MPCGRPSTPWRSEPSFTVTSIFPLAEMHLKDTQKISPTVSGKFFCSVYALGPAATTSALMWVYFLKFSTKLAASFLQLA